MNREDVEALRARMLRDANNTAKHGVKLADMTFSVEGDTLEALCRAWLALDGEEPKTLPVPTRVYLVGETAVIAGNPQRGWDEDGPDAHNCDDMGCSTFGRHVLARVPFTDERALPTQQGGGEINMDVTVRDGAWVGTYAEWCRRKQPAVVDEFAADRERLLRAFMMECGIIGAKEAGVNLARSIKAALAAQHQEPKP